MRATVMHGAGDVRVEHVPEAGLVDSTAIGIARRGGAVGRVGGTPGGMGPRLAAGVLRQPDDQRRSRPARAYIEDLLPDIVEGRTAPGRVLDRTVDLDGVPGGYQAMAEREAIKVMVTQ